MIKGNLDGIKKIYIETLEDLIEMDVERDVFIPYEVMNVVCEISNKIKREIAVYISRKGRILEISIGDEKSVRLEEVSLRKDKRYLSGVRCLHTHVNGFSELSEADTSALFNLKLDAIAAVSAIDGRAIKISLGFLKTYDGKIINDVEKIGPLDPNEFEKIDILKTINSIEGEISKESEKVSGEDRERFIVVGGFERDDTTSEESLNELEELVKTAGGKVEERVIQYRDKIDSAYYIGRGKVEEIALMVQNLSIDSVVFDDELNGAQVRNLEEILGCKVIDRTTLILDIFAQRAKSRDGKIQVELAQLKYRLPRLSGMGLILSRTGGGIGTRGPGETKLETDRRHIKERIYDLQDELKKIQKTRQVQRSRRQENKIPVISLAGYTNAGKSTLRNKLCELYGEDKEKVFEADMLFATLDTTTRLVKLPSGRDVLISDTVGFINKLPHDLVEAFKSTLEEVVQSNLIIHVVDVSSKNAISQIETVNKVLSEIGAEGKRTIIALNKIDRVESDSVEVIRSRYENTVEVSARYGLNLESLLKKIEEEMYKNLKSAELLIPYSDASMVSFLHESNSVVFEEYREDGIYLRINASEEIYGKVRSYML